MLHKSGIDGLLKPSLYYFMVKLYFYGYPLVYFWELVWQTVSAWDDNNILNEVFSSRLVYYMDKTQCNINGTGRKFDHGMTLVLVMLLSNIL